MILGVGVDLVSVPRIERLLERYGAAFERRIFSAKEKRNPAEGRSRALAAARSFAVKEALGKSLGAGLFSVPFREMELSFDSEGRAFLLSSEKFSEMLTSRLANGFFIDTACAGDYVAALVVLEGGST